MYCGRRLVKYLAAYQGLAVDEPPTDALVPLVHLRGNRTIRLNHRLLNLMTEAWEAIGLDTRKRSGAAVRKHLETLIREENEVRVRNDLNQLIVPADKTIKAHRDRLLSPSEVHVAISGIAATRNQHGRGAAASRHHAGRETRRSDPWWPRLLAW